MGPTIYVPVTSQGIADASAVECARQVIANGARTVVIAAHGWTVTADEFMAYVDLMVVGLEAAGLELGDKSLIVPLHWKASAVDDDESAERAFDIGTFYLMRDRADSVGRGPLFHLIQTLISTANGERLNIILIGHSFGCRVVASALTQFSSQTATPPKFTVILLQGAFDWDAFEPMRPYAKSETIFGINVLVTFSKSDKALNRAYWAANGFHHAIGAGGPTAKTQSLFGTAMQVSDIAEMQANYPGLADQWAGTHSVIYIRPLFELMSTFIRSRYAVSNAPISL